LQSTVTGSGVVFDWNDIPESIGYLFQGQVLSSGATKNKKRATSGWNVSSLPPGNYAWRVKTACPLDTSVFSQDALFSIPMLRSVDQARTTSDLWAAPNPAVHYTMLQWEGPAVSLELTDINGRVLHREILGDHARQYRLSVADFPAGMYLVQLHKAEGKRAIGRLMVR
jgi:hypothetical protein